MRTLTGLFVLFALGTAQASDAFPVPPLLDTNNTSHRIGENAECKAIVILFLGVDCPLCQRYAPTLKKLAETKPKGIEFYGIVSQPYTTRKETAKYAKDYEIPFPVLFDPAASVAAWLKPTHVPEAFVLNPEGKVLYRGRIDNWYIAPGKPRGTVTSHDLNDAMEAVAAGKSPAVAKTEPVGCFFEEKIPAPDAAPEKVTFTRHIAPILFQHCVACHRPGEVAPFSLLTFADASKRAKQIAKFASSREMPPWKPEPGFGHFLEERRLTKQEIATVARWAATDAVEGNEADMPKAPEFPDGWALGKPDLIIKMPEDFTIPASGPDVLRNFVIPLNNEESKMVRAMEFRPGNRKVVHHALCFLDASGTARKLDAEEKGPGYNAEKGGLGFLPVGSLGGWAPGNTPRFVPDEMGRFLPKGSDAVLQVHYHPSGKAETDRSEVGVYFLKKPAKKLLGGVSLENWHIQIPAGEASYTRKAEFTLNVDTTFIGVAPHMHLLGKEMKAWAELPNGKTVPLIHVKDWDFNWQDYYLYRKPFTLPKGTTLRMESRHDNSSSNRANPNVPPKRIKYGEGTADEMSLCIFEVTCESIPDLLKLIGSNVEHLKIIERFTPQPKK